MSSMISEELKREIGQHFVVGFNGYELNDDIKMLIKDYYVGNIILMKRNVQNAHQVKQLTYALQAYAQASGHIRPLLIGTDQENGMVSAFSSSTAGTQFPGAMALAATGSTDLAKEVSAGKAKELISVGINWVYSPVADVNSNPRNPVIGVRSFGDDPNGVASFASAVGQGLLQSMVAPSAKHFPGHGDTHVDSHLGLPQINKSREELLAADLIPFKKLIDEGIPTIMTGHMALPKVTGDLTPSSLSREITTNLLRRELDFRMVVVTDCLEMDAVVKGYGTEHAAVEAIKAGADIAMICHTPEKQRGAIENVWRAVADRSINHAELKASDDRITLLKGQFAGSWSDVLYDDRTDTEAFESQWAALKQQNEELSKRAYRKSIAVVADPFHSLPLPKDGTILVLTPEIEMLNKAIDDPEELRSQAGMLRNTAGASYLAFAAAISKRSRSQHVVYSQTTGHSAELPLTECSNIIFVMRNANRSSWQISYLKDMLSRLSKTEHRKVILLSSCEPYDLLGEKDIKLAYVASFEFTARALSAATGALFGEFDVHGRVPVLQGGVNL